MQLLGQEMGGCQRLARFSHPASIVLYVEETI